MITNLSQLKRAFANKPRYKVVNHRKQEFIGQIRKVNVVQSNSIYSIALEDPTSELNTANGGKGIWLEYGKAALWSFKDGIATRYSDEDQSENSLVLSIEILED